MVSRSIIIWHDSMSCNMAQCWQVLDEWHGLQYTYCRSELKYSKLYFFTDPFLQQKQKISFWQSWFPAFLFIPYECVAGSFRKWNCCGFSRFQPLLEGDWKPKASGSFLIETTKIMHDFQSRVWTCGYVICGYVITISKHVHQHLSPRTLSWSTQQKQPPPKKTRQQPLDAPTTHALHI